MAKGYLQQRKRLAAVFASFALLICGTASLLQSMSIDYYSVLNTLNKAIPASIIIGVLGWVMGVILDQPRKRSRINYGSIMGNKLAKSEIQELPKISIDAE